MNMHQRALLRQMVGLFALTGLSCLVLILSGCSYGPSAADMANAMKALGNDSATVCVTVQGPWGTVTALRTNMANTMIKGCNDVEHGITVTPR